MEKTAKFEDFCSKNGATPILAEKIQRKKSENFLMVLAVLSTQFSTRNPAVPVFLVKNMVFLGTLLMMITL